MLGRRRFISATSWLALAATGPGAWPARAQGSAPRVLRIGVLGTNPPPQGPGTPLLDALAPYGLVQGKNLEFERRWADGQADRLPALAAELVRSKVDMILVPSTPEALAAKQATTTIPILLYGVGGDPVASGLVQSFANPGGNITGISWMTAEQGVKRLELLKELQPRVQKVAALDGTQMTEATRKALQTAAAAMRIELTVVQVRSEPDITAAISAMRSQGIQALTLIPSSLLFNNSKRIAELAMQQRLPFAGTDDAAEHGSLLGFSADQQQIYPRMAWFIDRIARGAKPADLAIERPTRFNLLVNLKTARALGVKIPSGFLARVDRVVE